MAKPSVVSAGKVFNQWTAIRFVSAQSDKANRRWLVRCSCGSERVAFIGSIVSGHSKSCGCQRKPSRDQMRVNLIFKCIKAGAKRRDKPFLLSKSDVAALAEKQGWKCIRTGIPLDLAMNVGKKRPFGPTIDRINNNLGYEPENIQLVCNLYNLCKNEFSDEDVLTFASALLNHTNAISTIQRAA